MKKKKYYICLELVENSKMQLKLDFFLSANKIIKHIIRFFFDKCNECLNDCSIDRLMMTTFIQRDDDGMLNSQQSQDNINS